MLRPSHAPAFLRARFRKFVSLKTRVFPGRNPSSYFYPAMNFQAATAAAVADEARRFSIVDLIPRYIPRNRRPPPHIWRHPSFPINYYRPSRPRRTDVDAA